MLPIYKEINLKIIFQTWEQEKVNLIVFVCYSVVQLMQLTTIYHFINVI